MSVVPQYVIWSSDHQQPCHVKNHVKWQLNRRGFCSLSSTLEPVTSDLY
jgi:hypothetical protein